MRIHFLPFAIAAFWLLLLSASDPAVAAPGNLGNDILYYITVDRFYDAEPENNVPLYAFPLETNLEQDKLAERKANRLLLEQMFDPTRRYINLHWGGDLAGVLQKLDYLQTLGVTKIVLSPIQDRANGFTYTPGAPGYLHFAADPEAERIDSFYAGLDTGFQGDWLKDWFELDEHLGSPTERDRILRQLLDAAGARGIGVILTLPLNATSPYREDPFTAKIDLDTADTWFIDGGGVFEHGEKVATYWRDDRANPQGWFHPFKKINYTHPAPKALEEGAVGGIPDLNQDNPAVEQYLLDAARFWLTFNPEGTQIAGFYLESLPNINVRFWQKLEREIRAIAPEAILIGEYPGGGYRNADSIEWYEQTNHYALLNYDLSVAARRFFSRDRSWDGRTKLLRETALGAPELASPFQRWLQRLFNVSGVLEIPPHSLEVVSSEETKGWVGFIENRDLPRLFSSNPQLSETAYRSLIEFIFTSPGVPMLMYGTEAGLAVPYHVDHRGVGGVGAAPFNQPMMIWPDVPGWSASLYQTTQAMVRLRKQHAVLREGTTRFLFPSRSNKSDDLFMLRELRSSQAVSPSETLEAQYKYVLFSYSTHGGEFSIPIADIGDVHSFKDIGTNRVEQDLADSIALKLDPEKSKVITLW